MVVVHPVWADEYQTANELLARVDSAESENLSPDIRAAYDALKESLNSAENLYNEYQSELNENLDAMRETEQSFENRMLGGATMGATGIGGQMLASGLAEQSADDAAIMDMNAYLATFKCDYGMGLNISGGETNITLPGANILLPLRNEYIELATRLRQAKESLGLPLGIESVEILDPTDANLYDNAAVGVTDYALDTAAERAASTETDEKIQTGAITAGVGAAAGLVGNLIINRDAPKERSREITAEYEKDKREIDNEIAENEQALTQAIEDNSKLVEEYNALLRLHKEFVLTITETECIPEFQEYIDYINGLDYITDMMTDASELVIEYDLDEMRAAYTECADAAALRRQIAECEAQEYHEWVDGECVDNTPQCDQGYHLDENGECVPDAVAGDDGPDGTDGTDADDDDDNDGTDDGLDDDNYGVDDGLDDDNEDANDDEDVVITGDLSCDAITNQSECENSESDCYWNNGTCMSMACPDENPRFSSARGKRVGDACTYGNVARGHIFKYAAGTMRGDVDVGGTCSCSADTCADGYKLESGMCTNCADGYHKDENDECVPDETSVDDTDNEDITLPICPYEEFQANWEITNADTCVDFCKKRAQEQNCQYQGATFSNNICRCSPSKTSDLPPLVYYQVCGNDQGKTDGDEICVDEFFEDTRVQPNQAIALASEYARVKENDENIICNETPRNCRINIVTNGDCIQCTSRGAEKKYYEFRFRRVDATGDANIQQSVLTSLCKLYDTNVSAGFIPGNPISRSSAFCRTDDSTVCQKINDSAARFGYQAQMGLVEVSDRRSVTQQHDDVCVLLRSVTSVDNLRTMDDIDPYYFKKQGIQLQLGTDIENRICTYVQNTIHPTALTDCRCNDNTTPIRDVTSRLTVGPNDDVITCRINGQTVDFVFDDLSEASNINRRAGEQAMDCIVQGGTYDGKHCLHLNQEQCNALANANLQSCPECRKVKWNPDEEICELPNSESAQNLKRGLEITGQVALITGAAALTIVTGGGGAGIVVMVGLETVGGAMSVVAMDKQHEAAYDFLTESNRCKDPSCAEDLIKTNLQRLANLLKNFDDVQIAAIDTELERLIELLPNDSKLFTEFESLSPADLQKGFFDPESWEPEDVWETVGNVLSITTVIASIGSAALRQLTRATRAITTRVNTGTRAVTISNKADDVFSLTRAQAKRLDDLALEEQRLLARQAQNPGAREAAEIRSNLTRVHQERQTLLNQLGNPSEEALNAAKAEAYRLDDLQQAEAELARLQQERANLYTTNRNGQQVLRNGRTRHDVTALDNQIAAQQQRIRELGGAVDGAVDDAADAVGAGARTGGESDDAARSADDATNAARGADAVNAATDSADDAARSADDATDAASAGARGADATNDATDAATDATRTGGAADNAARGASNTSKATRLASAKQAGRAGYHGTNVDLTDDVLLQPSVGSRPEFSGVSIAQDIETARNYAINRLVKMQNPHLDNGNFVYSNGVLEITSDRPLNLSNKSIYIYELETDSDGWMSLYNGYAGRFNAHYNQEATEWLAKTEENLDDLIASGRVRIIQPSAADDVADAATDAASAGTRGAGGAANAVRSATEQASDMLNNSGFRAALDEFEQTGKINAVFPRDAVSDDAWNVINSNLESRGIRMRSGTSGGRDIMAFDNIPDHPATIARLRNRASKRFNEYFDTLKSTGRGVSWLASRLTDDEWKIVNDSLADDGIRLRRIDNRMIMEEIPNHPATVARQQARDAARAGDAADDATRANVNSREVNYILTNSERATYRNTHAYVYQPTGLKESEAGNIAEMINDEGNYYAAILNKEGYNGADYMVITMSKSDADKMRYSWSGSDLTYPIDNSQNMARLRQQIGKPITSIRGTPVVIETMSDFGRRSGRAIVMVRVGNKKIPFYISSGSAGKTDVPTGKWEFFGGITEEKGWFRKGSTIKEINNHYDSAELKQIADALDNKIGDLRDTELVLKTIGRQKLGGSGKVATCQNAPAISPETINQSFPKPVQRNGFARDLNAIKDYLRSL